MANTKNALWLPKGSVRAILAIGIIASYIYTCAINAPSDALGVIGLIVVKDYFDKKV